MKLVILLLHLLKCSKCMLLIVQYKSLSKKINYSSKTLYYRNVNTLRCWAESIYWSAIFVWKSVVRLQMFGSFFEYWDNRHQNIDRELRHCINCLKANIYTIKYELHMLLLNILYSNLRKEFCPQPWLRRPNCDQFF